MYLPTPESHEFGHFSSAQGAILSDIADIMIPKTETVGAAETKVVLLLDQLMLSWAGEATKREVDAFIESLSQYVLATFQTDYLNLPKQDRQALLAEIDAASFSDEPDRMPVKSYRRIKWLIFHMHYTSEAANPDFVLIPGQYAGDLSEAEYLALVAENRY
ncbi:MAG: gluconate 2-dehydrogenase subunit 3 family protein [Pseudomonadota bacterium]